VRWALLLLVACGAAKTPSDPANHSAVDTTADHDGDGIPDFRDKCPDQPEDIDAFQDADGCPDPDDDHDGVPDEQDMCPDQAGSDSKGCPGDECYFVTSVNDCNLIWTPMWSDTGVDETAEIKKTLGEYPEIEQIKLHSWRTDAEPIDTAQRRLAKAQAALVARGVSATRIVLFEERPQDASRGPSHDVWADIAKQKYQSGKFREAICAGNLGAVYRPSRPEKPRCITIRCGDGICSHDVEDDTCPADCS